jgi:hypothetical protein
MNYRDEPPATFKCGHPRSRENMRFNGGHPKCKQCDEVYHRAYNKAYKQAEPKYPIYPLRKAA